MSENPWLRLPDIPPFVLSDDDEAVQRFNAQSKDEHRILTSELIPETFVGDPAAPVLLLSNNPGFGKRAVFRQHPEFMKRMREIICLNVSKYPFMYLDPEFREAGGWWRQKLKCLIGKFGDEVVARSVCNVVYFPYPSRKFAHRRCELSSQQFSFDIVRAAVRRGAVIVLMRKGKLGLWHGKVSELTRYHNLVLLRNPQTPAISPNNCDSGDYEKVVRAIEAAESKGGHSAR